MLAHAIGLHLRVTAHRNRQAPPASKAVDEPGISVRAVDLQRPLASHARRGGRRWRLRRRPPRWRWCAIGAIFLDIRIPVRATERVVSERLLQQERTKFIISSTLTMLLAACITCSRSHAARDHMTSTSPSLHHGWGICSPGCAGIVVWLVEPAVRAAEAWPAARQRASAQEVSGRLATHGRRPCSRTGCQRFCMCASLRSEGRARTRSSPLRSSRARVRANSRPRAHAGRPRLRPAQVPAAVTGTRRAGGPVSSGRQCPRPCSSRYAGWASVARMPGSRRIGAVGWLGSNVQDRARRRDCSLAPWRTVAG